MRLWQIRSVDYEPDGDECIVNLSSTALGLKSFYKDLFPYLKEKGIPLREVVLSEIEAENDDIEHLTIQTPEKYKGTLINENFRSNYYSIRTVATMTAQLKKPAHVIATYVMHLDEQTGIVTVEPDWMSIDDSPMLEGKIYVDKDGNPQPNNIRWYKPTRYVPYQLMYGMTGCPGYFYIPEAYDCANDVTMSAIIDLTIKAKVSNINLSKFMIKDILPDGYDSLIQWMYDKKMIAWNFNKEMII